MLPTQWTWLENSVTFIYSEKMCFLYFFRGFSWFQAFLCLIWALNSHQTMPRPPRLYIYNKKYIRTKFWQPSGALVIYSWKVLSPPRGQKSQKKFQTKNFRNYSNKVVCVFLGTLDVHGLDGAVFSRSPCYWQQNRSHGHSLHSFKTHIQIHIHSLTNGSEQRLDDARSQNNNPH